MYKMADAEGSVESKLSIKKETLKRFSEEAKDRGFINKVTSEKYENKRRDTFVLEIYRPYTTRIRFSVPIDRNSLEFKIIMQNTSCESVNDETNTND